MTSANTLHPRQRQTISGHATVLDKTTQAIATNTLINGWMITGGEGAGKATLAYHLARKLLGNTEKSNKLIANGSHPDLFVAERIYDEKKEKFAVDIKIDTIRKLTSFMSHTASMGGWRVAIVDTADHLNRNAANALLKNLEEPPAKTTLFLLSAAPGRLLPTVRSRCRRIDLRPVATEKTAAFLKAEGIKGDMTDIIDASQGRPGYALSLANSSGMEAVSLVDAFLKANTGHGDIMGVIQKISLKSANDIWPIFKTQLISRISSEIKLQAIASDKSLSAGDIEPLIDAYEKIIDLLARGDAINIDRGQMMLRVAQLLSAAQFRNIS